MLRTTLLFLFLLATATLSQEAAQPPVATKKPKQTTIHGETLVDNYHYFREKENPEVLKYLSDENAYTKAMMKPTEKLQEKLNAEFLSRTKQTDLSVPTLSHGYWYYSRTQEGQQYPIYCRKKGTQEAKEEVMLEVNELAKPHKFFAVESFAISYDDRYIAYTYDITGFRQATLAIKDLTTGQLLPDSIARVHSPNWSADGKYLFYLMEDPQTKRVNKLFRHEVGKDAKTDTLVHEEKDELYELELDHTLDRQYLFLTIASSETTEVRYLAATQPTSDWTTISTRQENHRYYLTGHRDDAFYLKSNRDAKNFKLVKTPVKKLDAWTDVVAHRDNVLLEGITLLQDYLIVDERTQGLDRLMVHDLATMQAHAITMTEPTYALSASSNPEFTSKSFRFAYTSFVTPHSVFEYDLVTRTQKLLKEQEVPGGYDRKAYETERLWITARDGVKVPISLVHKKGFPKDGSRPCLLHGYGAYGAPTMAEFSVTEFSLLDRGFVYAIAHIRGGNEMGERWHDDGKMLNKKKTFFDFIDAGNWLCDNKYTSHNKLTVMGGSAGGLLIASTIHLSEPGFCQAAILDVPFVDVINTMLDETIPLTFPEFLEWGNPKKKAEYDYMKSYCPYTNLTPRQYPAMLVLTSLNDSQVMYWEPTKYVAKLRTVKQGDSPLLLKCNMNAGHGGSSGRYDSLKEDAYNYAFLLWNVGIKE